MSATKRQMREQRQERNREIRQAFWKPYRDKFRMERHEITTYGVSP